MIAAVSEKLSVVLGVGRTPAEALFNAKQVLSEKCDALKNEGLGKLRYVPLRKDAPLDGCGYTLYKYCIFDADPGPRQLSLF